MTNAESVKARLKNLTVKDGGAMQDKLTTYAMERSICHGNILTMLGQYLSCSVSSSQMQ